MADSVAQLSPEANAVLFRGLDYGVENVRDSGGPLVPFVMCKDGEGITLQRFLTNRLEDGPGACRAAVRSLPSSVTCYVIVYDGFITIPGQAKTDAIIAEAGERGNPQGLRLAQRYRPRKGLLGRFALIGNPALLGAAQNLLSEASR